MSNPAAPQPVGQAYDAVADDYDRLLARDLWMRRVLWRHFDRVFRAGDHVLDAGCGTGLDTIHLAARGVRVTAVDASPRMAALLTAKVAAARFAPLVRVACADVGRWADAPASDTEPRPDPPLDGIISSFAALNTIDLAAFAAMAARRLRPGGRMVGHLLARHEGQRGGDAAVSVGGTWLRHALPPPPAEIHARVFAKDFILRRAYGLGFRPTAILARHLPAPAAAWIGRLESFVGAAPALQGRGQFLVLDLERRAGP